MVEFLIFKECLQSGFPIYSAFGSRLIWGDPLVSVIMEGDDVSYVLEGSREVNGNCMDCCGILWVPKVCYGNFNQSRWLAIGVGIFLGQFAIQAHDFFDEFLNLLFFGEFCQQFQVEFITILGGYFNPGKSGYPSFSLIEDSCLCFWWDQWEEVEDSFRID